MLLTIFIGFIWFLGGIVNGVAAFGANLFAIPLLALVMPAKDAIVIGCLVFPACALACCLIYRKGISWSEGIICSLCLGLGFPLGTYFLRNASQRVILLGSAFCVMLILLFQWFSAKIAKTNEKTLAPG